MSIDTEIRMCEALNLPSPKRPPRRFYRPCLSVELGDMIREYGVDVEETLRDCIARGVYREAI